MLSNISIRNLGVIEEANLELAPGFSVLTGETGAGKTMILSALNLLSGARSDTDLIRIGTERLSVSASVDLTDTREDAELTELVDNLILDSDESEILLSRALTKDGKSRATIGSDNVTASALHRFSSKLFQIHGQSTNHEILERDRQLELLDAFDGEIQETLKAYREIYDKFKEVEKFISDMDEKERNRDREIARLQEFLEISRRVSLKRDEFRSVKSLIARMDSSEKWVSALQRASYALQEDGISSLNEAKRALQEIGSNQEVDALLERLSAIEIEASDLAQELQRSLNKLDLEPMSVDELRGRLADITSFVRKFSYLLPSDTPDEERGNALLEIHAQYENELRQITSGERGRAELLEQKKRIEEELSETAERLSHLRRSAAEKASQAIMVELRDLGLDNSRFEIRIESSLVEGHLSRDGGDQVAFLFTSHFSNDLLPIGKGISGGELSRLMLAVELVLSRGRRIGTLIFDEIDVGIGGETALVIGERLQRLSTSFQIIVVTHLAQVAAWADHHYVIEKSVDGRFVSSSVRMVSGEERAIEIARMLSGQSELSIAREHAKELLKHAKKI